MKRTTSQRPLLGYTKAHNVPRRDAGTDAPSPILESAGPSAMPDTAAHGGRGGRPPGVMALPQPSARVIIGTPEPDDVSRSSSPEASAPAALPGRQAAPLVVPAGFSAVDDPTAGSFVATDAPLAGAFGLDTFGVPYSEG